MGLYEKRMHHTILWTYAANMRTKLLRMRKHVVGKLRKLDSFSDTEYG